MFKRNCWILSDNLIGHEKQSISLAEKLNITYKIIKTKKLNFVERKFSFFFDLKKKKIFQTSFSKTYNFLWKTYCLLLKINKKKIK